jgi:FkbM family methyltransferase
MPSALSHIRALNDAVGPLQAAGILAGRALGRGRVSVRCRGRSFVVRPTNSDLFVLGQIFGSQDYDFGDVLTSRLNALAGSLRKSGRAPVIVDAGANVGYSAAYFAATFPEAVVLAVEADAVTFEVLKENVAGIPNVVPVNAAIWSHERGVNFGSTDGNGSWAHHVSEGAGSTPSIRLGKLLERVPDAAPLIVKIDIEGGEKEMCRAALDVLRQTPCIVVEPHDFMLPGAACLSPLLEALSGRELDTLVRGENIVFCDSALRRDS